MYLMHNLPLSISVGGSDLELVLGVPARHLGQRTPVVLLRLLRLTAFPRARHHTANERRTLLVLVLLRHIEPLCLELVVRILSHRRSISTNINISILHLHPTRIHLPLPLTSIGSTHRLLPLPLLTNHPTKTISVQLRLSRRPLNPAAHLRPLPQLNTSEDLKTPLFTRYMLPVPYN